MVDKKAEIRSLLRMVTVPADLQRAARLEAVKSDSGAPGDTVGEVEADTLFAAEFEVACMKSLKDKI